jgi:4-hydroxy-3-methylbut-2-enyl diphosphate reductase IspH
MTSKAKQIVEIINQTTNDYDAVEEITKFLEENFKEKKVIKNEKQFGILK